MNIEMLSISVLNPAEYNPRTISKDEFSGLKKSIKTFGFVDPAIINKDFTIIGGHQRIKAAEALGMTDVPCVILDLDKHAEKKLNVILNSPAISGKSGSTLIACEQTDRTCYGMELDPKYCDVIRKRYAKFIGKEDTWQEVTPLVGQQ